jgi:hypothetical protein
MLHTQEERKAKIREGKERGGRRESLTEGRRKKSSLRTPPAPHPRRDKDLADVGLGAVRVSVSTGRTLDQQLPVNTALQGPWKDAQGARWPNSVPPLM